MATIPADPNGPDQWTEEINGRLAHVRRFVPSTPSTTQTAYDPEGMRRALAGELPGVIVRRFTSDGRRIDK